jgi:hypothetical protein
VIELIFKIKDIFYSSKSKYFPLDLEFECDYFLKAFIEIGEEEVLDFSECFIEIINLPDPSRADEIQEEIMQHKFFTNTKKKFSCEKITPYNGNACMAELFYNFPAFNEAVGKVINIEIYQIKNEVIENLNTNPTKKHELFDIIDRFLNEDYRGALNEIAKLAEYIAYEIAKKVKENISNLNSAVNTLCSLKGSNKEKINYKYLGSLLWPLYYIRNQQLHAYPEIEINHLVAKTAFSILSEIVRYLSKNNIKF